MRALLDHEDTDVVTKLLTGVRDAAVAVDFSDVDTDGARAMHYSQRCIATSIDAALAVLRACEVGITAEEYTRRELRAKAIGQQLEALGSEGPRKATG